MKLIIKNFYGTLSNGESYKIEMTNEVSEFNNEIKNITVKLLVYCDFLQKYMLEKFSLESYFIKDEKEKYNQKLKEALLNAENIFGIRLLSKVEKVEFPISAGYSAK